MADAILPPPNESDPGVHPKATNKATLDSFIAINDLTVQLCEILLGKNFLSSL